MKEIIICTGNNQIRAAVKENDRLTEIIDGMNREKRLAGSIFLGKVKNIVPGMQAAFVDIGQGKNAFLYAGDALKSSGDSEVPPIRTIVYEGQELLVQVMRDPSGEKGARITTNISIPGRFAVIVPGSEGVMVSRKISPEEERRRLAKLVDEEEAKEFGIIIRTLSAGCSEQEIREDLARLRKISMKIKELSAKRRAPADIWTFSDLFDRLTREIIDEEVDRIIIDNGELAEELREKLREVSSEAAGRVWTDFKEDLFVRYNVEMEIREAIKSKVVMESGGFLVIEHTEALDIIDVNTGKFVGERSQQDTFLKQNIEAAKESARQIKLRNLSGIIVIDFIDMESEEDWDQVLECLRDQLRRDRSRSRLLGKTRLGLVEITRKKEGQSLLERYSEKCQDCGGIGRIIKVSV